MEISKFLKEGERFNTRVSFILFKSGLCPFEVKHMMEKALSFKEISLF